MTAAIPKPAEGAFAGNEHCYPIRVHTEDTDFGGVVYHANYLCFLERARSDMLRALQIDQRASFEAGQGVYAVSELRIKYRKPAKLDDDLLIISKLIDVRGASCTIEQRILRSQETIADATVKAAFVTPAGRPSRQPEAWVKKFEMLNGPTR